MTHARAAANEPRARLIDRWFPVAAVDAACGTPAGSGSSEKALFTWFASRPIAQARAAVLGAALPADADREQVDAAVRSGDPQAIAALAKTARGDGPKPPVVFDCFSGRGIIPLEAARLGLRAVGTDSAPVAVVASRLLADWPLRDWSDEPVSPFTKEPGAEAGERTLFTAEEPQLLADVRGLLAEAGRRMAAAVAPYYPPYPDGSQPWGTLWAITIPCDACKRRFPVIGSMVLRHPEHKRNDRGQALRLVTDERAATWTVEVIDGVPDQEPTFRSQAGRRGKVACCPFKCGKVHTLETLKAKNRPVHGGPGQYRDEPLLVADIVEVPVPGRNQAAERKVFRPLRDDERAAIAAVNVADLEPLGALPAVPDEPIPPGNEDTVRPSAYGYRRYGDLMNRRQTLLFVESVRAIRSCHSDLLEAGLSEHYAAALTAYAAATMTRRLRVSTRGATLHLRGNSRGTENNRTYVSDLFSKESKIPFEFDYFETGPDAGPGTWDSISGSEVAALEAHISSPLEYAGPAHVNLVNATALPWRDDTVDMVVTDPPYHKMIDYADVSDLFFVWLRRCLHDVLPETFGDEVTDEQGLQDKRREIIVKRGGADREHRTRDWYEQQLSAAFTEIRRVLKPGGHLVVVFGHSDPDAWRRLLGALRDAGFVVTSAWPARTEGATTGVASIKVTVTIGCRVAPTGRRSATVAQVEREIAELVTARTRQWEADGLALSDQLMAAYGPAMEVVGRYHKVLATDGTEPVLDRFLTVGRRAVRDAQDLKIDRLPLDTFDAATRFALFWLRAFGRVAVPKGEARFHAQADDLRLDDVRSVLLEEVKAGFKLSLVPAGLPLDEHTPVFEVMRVMAARWPTGGTEGVAEAIGATGRSADDQHLWAVVGEVIRQLPSSDTTAIALTSCQRNRRAIEQAAARLRRSAVQAEAQLPMFGQDAESP